MPITDHCKTYRDTVQGLFAPRYFRSEERKITLGTFAFKNGSSWELLFQGVNVPGKIRSVEQ